MHVIGPCAQRLADHDAHLRRAAPLDAHHPRHDRAVASKRLVHKMEAIRAGDPRLPGSKEKWEPVLHPQ